MASSLPDDILHMVCLQLRHQRDFNTLYNCARSGKQLAVPALANIYRMHDVAPVTNGPIEDEVSGQPRTGDLKAISNKQQERAVETAVMKWASLWRTTILSSLGKTLFPYCLYIRSLDLQNLKYLLEDLTFRGKVSSMFFDNELASFNIEMNSPMKLVRRAKGSRQLNFALALDDIGEAITKKTPMLEELSADVTNSALSRWIPRLPRLQRLRVWSGEALNRRAGDLIRLHCPSFKVLKFYQWADSKADDSFAAFLNGLRPQSLESFETFSYSKIGAQSFIALNSHFESLTELKLNPIESKAMPALAYLQGCTCLKLLALTEANGFTDLENAHNDSFLEIVSWLRNCKKLEWVSFRFRSAPAVLIPVLLENDIHLLHLEVENYHMTGSRPFHQALGHQDSLEELWLKGDGEEALQDDLDILVESVSKLGHIQDLRLRELTEEFSDKHICRLAGSLPALRGFDTSGNGISDAIWPSVASLKSLHSLQLSAITTFTADGILEYISQLGRGNQGLSLSVMMQDVDYRLTDEEQAIIRQTLASKVDGRFDFTFQRDPDVSSFEGDSD